MRIAICDDDSIVIDDVRWRIQDIDESIEYEGYNSSIDLLVYLKNKGYNYYDLIILDHLMPEINGLQLAEILRKNNFTGLIVFLTSEVDIIDDTFKVLPFRFLRKPINKDRFNEMISAAHKKITKNRLIEVPVSKLEKMVLKINDIVLFEAGHRKSIVVTRDSELESTRYISDWENFIEEEKLNCFVRIAKSYIINLEHVIGYSKGYRGGSVKIDNVHYKELEVSSSYWNHFLDSMNVYSLSNKVTI